MPQQTKLEMNFEDRYVQGPHLDKDSVLKEVGGYIITPIKQISDIAPDHCLVVVVESNVQFHAALKCDQIELDRLWRDIEYNEKHNEHSVMRWYAVPTAAFTFPV